MVSRYVGDLIDQQEEAARLAAVPNTLPDTGTKVAESNYDNRDMLLNLIQQSNVPQKKVEMNTGLLSGDQKGFMDVLKSPDQAQLSALIGLGAGFLNPKGGQPALTGAVNALKSFSGARERDYEREVDTEERAQSDLSRRLQAAVGYDTIERRDQNQANLEAGIVREDAYRQNVAQQADTRAAKSMYSSLLANQYTPQEARAAVEQLYPGMLPEAVTSADTNTNLTDNTNTDAPPTVNDLTNAKERAIATTPATGGTGGEKLYPDLNVLDAVKNFGTAVAELPGELSETFSRVDEKGRPVFKDSLNMTDHRNLYPSTGTEDIPYIPSNLNNRGK